VELVASGARSEQYVTISPITNDCAASRYRGKELKADQLLLLEPRGEVFQQFASGHRQIAVSIPVDLFRRVAAAEFLPEERVEDFLAWRNLVPNQKKLRRLRRTLRGILRGEIPSSLTPGVGVSLTGIVLGVLFDDETRDAKVVSHQARRQIIWDALDLIHASPQRCPSILGLCEATGASRRTLFYAFNELLGLSPNAYIKKFRLGEARRVIIENRQQRCVQRVARKLGFTHEGQFSIDYSSAFGESPSETRRRFLGLNKNAALNTE
jgi:AraC-like DNA-binding protein